jgi:hypothetical protein
VLESLPATRDKNRNMICNDKILVINFYVNLYKSIVMERKELINNIVAKINHLPDEKVREVNDFTEFLLSKIDDKLINEGIKKLTSEGKSFDFLKDEENLYSVNDLIERYK